MLPVIASSTLSCSGQLSSNSCPVSGHVPSSTGLGQVSSVISAAEWRRGQPRRPLKRKSDSVTMATCCSSGGVTMATNSSNVTHGNDTVPCMQQHSGTPAQHSATPATNDTGINRAGSSVVTGKQHGAGTVESTQRHSAVGQSEKQHGAITDSYQRATAISSKPEAHIRGSAVTTTSCTTTTMKLSSRTTTTQSARPLSKDSLTTANDAFLYPKDCLATVSTAVYTNDCAVPMLWLPDQSFADDIDEKEDYAGCKLMMSPASVHFIPLLAAPHPYPCIEPMYVDMATVGMATLGVGMPTADVGIAAEHVGMTTTDVAMAMADVAMETGSIAMSACSVGMATAGMAGGQVEHCLVSVDDDVATADALVWPTLYQCCDGNLPALGQPHISTATSIASIHPNAHLTTCQSQFAGSVPTASIPPHTSLTATAVSHNAPSGNLLDGPKPSLTLSDHADIPCGKSTLMMDDPVTADSLCHSAVGDGDAKAAGDADDLQAGSQVSAGSRPDVVSSNIPRSHVDQQPQLRQQDDDDVVDESNEVSCDAQASSIDEQLNNVDQQPPPPTSLSANVETGAVTMGSSEWSPVSTAS